MDNFGQNLKSLRKRMGLTQQELAEKLGVRKTTVSNYETSFSSPPKNVLIEIAEFFGVSLDELLGTNQIIPVKKTPAMNSPSPEKFTKGNQINIFSALKDSADIFSPQNLVDIVNFNAPMERGNYFGLVACDDSLKLRGISLGDYIIFKTQEVVKNGDIAAVSINGNTADIGIFHETESEIGFIPHAIDGVYLPKFFSKKDTSFKILGKAIRAVVNIKS